MGKNIQINSTHTEISSSLSNGFSPVENNNYSMYS